MEELRYDLSGYEQPSGTISLSLASQFAETDYDVNIEYDRKSDAAVIHVDPSQKDEVDNFVQDLVENL